MPDDRQRRQQTWRAYRLVLACPQSLKQQRSLPLHGVNPKTQASIALPADLHCCAAAQRPRFPSARAVAVRRHQAPSICTAVLSCWSSVYASPEPELVEEVALHESVRSMGTCLDSSSCPSRSSCRQGRSMQNQLPAASPNSWTQTQLHYC